MSDLKKKVDTNELPLEKPTCDTSSNDDADDIVTPWKAECGIGGFKYDRLIEKFGVQPIDKALIERFERVTKQPVHPWIRRGIFFAHRQLNEILDAYVNGEQIFLYTGRGPTTEALHLGHMVPFIFTKWLHEVFPDSILVIQIADDEKYWFKDKEFREIYNLGFQNVKDIIACGFDPKRTLIFSNRDYFYQNPCAQHLVAEMLNHINVNTIQSVFGLNTENLVGQYMWPFYQSAAAFSQFYEAIFGNRKVYCLVAYAIDQDPYFRVCRDIAPKLGLLKPCSIMTQFLPAIEGKAKMSSTGTTNTVFMTDNPKGISNVIKKHAYSGGCETLEEHRQKGANLEVDMSFQYLRYFEFDDDVLADIAFRYGSSQAEVEAQGKTQLTTGDIKQILIQKVTTIVSAHQERRAQVTKEQIDYFYDDRKFQKELALTPALRKIMFDMGLTLTEEQIQKLSYELTGAVTKLRTHHNQTLTFVKLKSEKEQGPIDVITEQQKQLETELVLKLESLKIPYEMTQHEIIKTMKEGKMIAKKLKGAVPVNLLFQSKEDSKYFLIVKLPTTSIQSLNSLGFGELKSVDRQNVSDVLNVPSGCVTLFAISQCPEITILMDKKVMDFEQVNFHPMRNDRTMTIGRDHMMKYIDHYKNQVVLFN